MPLKHRAYSEVDFTEFKDVQLSYSHNIYNVELQFTRSVLNMRFGKNNTAYDGLSYKVTPDGCEVNYSGLYHSFDNNVLPEDYLPVLVRQFFCECNGSLVTENYDSQKECCYLTRVVNNSFVRFEAYEHEGNFAYTLIIT